MWKNLPKKEKYSQQSLCERGLFRTTGTCPPKVRRQSGTLSGQERWNPPVFWSGLSPIRPIRSSTHSCSMASGVLTSQFCHTWCVCPPYQKIRTDSLSGTSSDFFVMLREIVFGVPGFLANVRKAAATTPRGQLFDPPDFFFRYSMGEMPSVLRKLWEK